jgi:hypothetical protein
VNPKMKRVVYMDCKLLLYMYYEMIIFYPVSSMPALQISQAASVSLSASSSELPVCTKSNNMVGTSSFLTLRDLMKETGVR